MSSTASKAVRLEIKVDGKSELTSGSEKLLLKDGGGVVYIRVDKSLDAPDTFEFRLNIQKDQTLTGLDNDLDGKPVEVALNIGESPKTVFKGEVTYIQPTFIAGSADSYVAVGGYDHSHRLTRGMNARTWGDGVKETDAYSDVASAVIGDSKAQKGGSSDSLSAEADKTSAKFTYVAQWNASDYHFLKSLGYDAGRPTDSDTTKDDKKILFKKIEAAGSPVLTLCRDKLEGSPAKLALNARLRLSTVQQYTKVVVRGWSPKDKKAIVGVAESAEQSFDGTPGWQRAGKALYGSTSAGRVYQVVNHPVTSQAEADGMAQAIFNRLALDFVTGELECEGFPDVEPGKLVELKGFGKRFSGKYLVTSVIHEVTRHDGFHTILVVARNAAPDPA
jgi:phage protein D